MAVVAAVAAALAALGASLAAGNRFLLLWFTVGPWWYGLMLAPAVVAVALGRRPVIPAVAIPPKAARIVKVACAVAVLLLLSAERLPDGVGAGLIAVAALNAVIFSFWWPHPAMVRASVAMSTVLLARPRAELHDNVVALALMIGASAVALVACNRLSTASDPVLGGVRPPARPRRVAAEAAFVALAVLLGAALAARMNESRPQPSQSRTGEAAQEQQPAPLAFQDVLDPNEAGLGRRGGDPDEALLEVDADRAGVLRAVTFDEWDGRRWRRSEVLGQGRLFDSRSGVPVGGDGLGGFPGAYNRQRIEVVAPYAGVAVGTPQVFFYDLPVGGRPHPDGTVELVPALGRGAVYVAQTGQRDVTTGQLRASRAGSEFDVRELGLDAGPGQVALASRALTAEPALSDRARALAERVTAGAATDYDKVAALTTYLDTAVEVSNDVGALPAGTDPVDRVLFGRGPSSPERLATTLAVLTRAVGLPARLAAGFLPGQRPFFGGAFVVRAGDAHAWVEVPFVGIGWQRFDPTGRIAAAEEQDSLWSRLKRAIERYWFVLVLVIVAAAALVTRRLIARRRRLAAIPWATRYFARLVRLGAKRGRPRRPAETPAEYALALSNTVLADERLVEVGRVVTAAAWSGRQPPATTQAWAEQVLDEAARATRSRRSRSKVDTSPP